MDSSDHWDRSALSRRTCPRRTGQTPASARISDVLPPPLGPINPRACPASRRIETSARITWPVDGATTVTLSAENSFLGSGKDIGLGSDGIAAIVSLILE